MELALGPCSESPVGCNEKHRIVTPYSPNSQASPKNSVRGQEPAGAEARQALILPFWLRSGGFNIFEHACLWHIAGISARQLASSLSRQRLSAALMGAP
jgi:hypothetical protein